MAVLFDTYYEKEISNNQSIMEIDANRAQANALGDAFCNFLKAQFAFYTNIQIKFSKQILDLKSKRKVTQNKC
jgi:hypothetical protein